MQENEIDSPHNAQSSPVHESGGFQPSTKLRDKLEKLAQWRIDPSVIEFPTDGCEFRGGFATVSRALLKPNHNAKGSVRDPEHTMGQRGDSAGLNSDSLCEGRQPADDQGKDKHQENHAEGDGDNQDKEGEKKRSGNPDETREFDGQISEPKVVAVKQLKIEKDTDLERVLRLALRESEFLLGLSHPNVIKLEGFVEDAAKHKIWLIFSWEEHGNLRDFLASGEWEIPERISLINDVAKGVEYLHSQSPPIYHGDLKSLNILVNSEFHAVITDFGSARRLEKDEDSPTTENPSKTRPGTDPTTDEESVALEPIFDASTNTITLTSDKYTLRWAAPELLNDGEPSLACDIWALGWIAYEVMTNNIPFHDVKRDTAIVNRVVRGDLPSITNHARMSLIQALCYLMAQCWRIDPAKRPTAEECKKSISWMPMIVPMPTQAMDTEASQTRYSQLLMRLGHMYKDQGDYINASDCFTKAMNIRTAMGINRGRAEALSDLALVYVFRGLYNEAVTLCTEALQIYDKIGDKVSSERARALGVLADVYRVQWKYTEARKLYSEALEIYNDLGDKQGKALTLCGLAEIHRPCKEYSDATSLLSEALKIYIDIGSHMGRASALWNLADIHQRQNEYDQANKLYSESLQIYKDLGDRQGRADCLFGLGRTHQLQGEYRDATAFYTEALRIFTDIDNKTWRAETLWYLAETHREQKLYDDAIRSFTEAGEIYEEMGLSGEKAAASKEVDEIRKTLESVS